MLFPERRTSAKRIEVCGGLAWGGLGKWISGVLVCGVFTAVPIEAQEGGVEGASKPDDFAHTVVPILKKHCIECHAGNEKKGGFSINTREDLLRGGESISGVGLNGDSSAAEMLRAVAQGLRERIETQDRDLRMPPDGPGLTEAEKRVLVAWVSQGMDWEPGFTFGERSYEPPLRPRAVELPPGNSPDRMHPIDRILDAVRVDSGGEILPVVDDRTFVRRAYLDLIGLLPTPEQTEGFVSSENVRKREELVRELLGRDIEVAEHWLTFWNDLLRNDYTGTGFITGGRTQITKWLYEALVANKPYDQMVRELIAPPSAESAGFSGGIKWRGEVSAGQTVEIQFAQSVGQAFLGINLKCASCHDSFIDRWRLKDAYGIAAVYANQPLVIHRCDKSTGEQATAGWLYPELGQVDSNAPQPQRLKQLADLMTHRENGRFARTIVNRIWHRMMGRGIVHPTDAMETQPWNEDLLDMLSNEFVASGYDLRKLIETIATSKAYQSPAERLVGDEGIVAYRYAGTRGKRLTAEQFVDAVWQLTGASPSKFDAGVVRVGPPKKEFSGESVLDGEDTSAGVVQAARGAREVEGEWIWGSSAKGAPGPAANETVWFRKTFELPFEVERASGTITCDNSYRLWVNGQLVLEDGNWEGVEVFSGLEFLRPGQNEILVEGKNGGSGPNPAALYFEWILAGFDPKGEQFSKPDKQRSSILRIVSSTEWQCFTGGGIAPEGTDRSSILWESAVRATGPWGDRLRDEISRKMIEGLEGELKMVRASLVKADFLMRSLGRPNRDQIVTVRPTELTTLEAMDLSNGETLAEWLRFGAKRWIASLAMRGEFDGEQSGAERGREYWRRELIEPLYLHALSRHPTELELSAIYEAVGERLESQDVEDLIWSLVMLPEFQYVR